MTATREKLGSIFTDTATLLIGDPCKVLYSSDDQERNHFTWEAYVDLCGDFCRKVVEVPDLLGRAGALSIQVGADGWYPVYLETDEDGRPARLVIELGGQVEP